MINYNRYHTFQEYVKFFTPELKKQLDTKKVIYDSKEPLHFLEELPENFDEKRKIGENDDELSEMIRNDQIENFITYVNKNNLPLNSKITTSIYETNDLLLRKLNCELIEYAAFYGSIQIFKYLHLNNVQFGPTIWFYAVHGDNPEIINTLEENNIIPHDIFRDSKLHCLYPHMFSIGKYEKLYIDQNDDENSEKNDDEDSEKNDDENNEKNDDENSEKIDDENNEKNDDEDSEKEKIDIYSKEYFHNFLKVLVESVKCHHNDITNYLYDKLYKDELNKNLFILESSLEYYNFNFIQNEIINQDSFFYFLCKFNYISPILLILNNSNFDNKINKCTLKFQYEDKIIEYKVTPLLAAFQTANIELFKILLLSSKINVNETIEMTEKRFKKFSSLEISVKIGLLPLVLGHFFEIDGSDFNAETLLIIKLLLSNNNVDVNAISIYSRKNNCLTEVEDSEMPSLSNEKPEIISKESSFYEQTALNMAIEDQNIEIIELLLANNKIDINKMEKKSEYNEYYDPREREYSGESHYKMKNTTTSPLIMAIKLGNIKIIKILLSNRNVDINLPYESYSNKKIEWNTFQRGEGYCSYFYHDSKTKNDLMSPLNYAINKDNIEIVKLLLDKKEIDVNFVRKYNESCYNEYRGYVEKKEVKKEIKIIMKLLSC